MDARIAYLAGLLDGEGCFYFSHGCYPTLCIEMTDERAPGWAHQQFGGCLYSKEHAPPAERSYIWNLTKRGTLLQLLPELREYLIVKQLHAIIFLEFYKRFPAGRSYSAQEVQRYIELIRVLNSRGIGSSEAKANLRRVIGLSA
jgi:hypothetical protein